MASASVNRKDRSPSPARRQRSRSRSRSPTRVKEDEKDEKAEVRLSELWKIVKAFQKIPVNGISGHGLGNLSEYVEGVASRLKHEARCSLLQEGLRRFISSYDAKDWAAFDKASGVAEGETKRSFEELAKKTKFERENEEACGECSEPHGWERVVTVGGVKLTFICASKHRRHADNLQIEECKTLSEFRAKLGFPRVPLALLLVFIAECRGGTACVIQDEPDSDSDPEFPGDEMESWGKYAFQPWLRSAQESFGGALAYIEDIKWPQELILQTLSDKWAVVKSPRVLRIHEPDKKTYLLLRDCERDPEGAVKKFLSAD